MQLKCMDSNLSLDTAAVMGVLNVTPDSFSDGGLWLEPRAAIEHGLEMSAEGAAILDVGGESTRPGAQPVPEDEELRRVIPVIEGLAHQGVRYISIDTRKAAVARRAIDAGANIVNDTLGEESDGSMDGLAAESGAAIVIVHSRGTPATMRDLTDYEDVTTEVFGFLEGRAAQLESAGVDSQSIVLDPGIGFAKTAEQSARLLRDVITLSSSIYPVLIGTSRKSFIGQLVGLDEGDRLEATLATSAWAVAQGVSIVRVHDVRPNVRAIRMVEAILAGGGG